MLVSSSSRGLSAIAPATAVEAKAAGLKEVTGVYVRSFSQETESPAKEAGIQPGDVIITADGKPADRVSTLQRIIRAHKPGETVTLEVMRFGENARATIENVKAKLKPGGEFRFGTDNPVYLRWALMQMRGRTDFAWLCEGPDDFLNRPGGWPETRYEAKARRKGHEVWYFRYRRA
jgi:membrane-associated protease RseP (regulator of RpoE activity)